MALVINDRVKETTTSIGTGTINLAGAEQGFESFVSGVGNANTTYYAIAGGNEWEIGIGTVTSGSPDTLSRDTIISSSNSDTIVTFSSGTKNVFCTLPASKFVYQDSSGNVGIGTSSPAGKLNVKVPLNSQDGLILSYNDTYPVGGITAQGSTGEVRIGALNTQLGSTYFPTFYSNNSEAMRISSGGNVGIGTSSPGSVLDVNGDIFAAGITFDSGSNVLEKYETGTWTPEYGGSTTDPDSITYDAVTSGVYTRIGNIVHAGFLLRTDAMTIGAGAGGPVVKGFPFSIQEGRWGMSMANKSAWVTNGPDYGLSSSTDWVRLYYESASTSVSGMSMSNFGTGANANILYGSITYRTNDA